MKLTVIIILIPVMVVWSCSRFVDAPKNADIQPPIFPDYCNVVVPVNIAPLNFKLLEDAERLIAIIEGTSETIRITGRNKILFPEKKWRKLLKKNSGGSLIVTLYAHIEGTWKKYKSFNIFIKEEPVDPWIVYRLIAPGYETWSEIGIYQRNLATFVQEPIINNRLLTHDCMNCHSFRANNPDEMMFHLRGDNGGTILVRHGNAVKLNTKVKETISNCVYPFWHPSGDFIVFSVNNIQQVFHSVKEKRIEVFDSRSDIVVLDIRSNKLITSEIISSDESFETFPTFTPDGKCLIFCSAKKGVQPDEYNKIRYSLCSISFDASSGSFGDKIDTLVSSNLTGKSVSFPRVSPDGRILVFTLSDYGNFSIWHREADLYQLDMTNGEFNPVDPVNSTEAESYHSWSSNSRWMIFSSRKMDGLYTRPFISYVSIDGTFSKPFMVPQKNPDFYDDMMRSFNLPEFITGKVKTNGREMLKTIEGPHKVVKFELKD